ncbi:MAG: IPT/TIG domain-containing protein, partial [Candidatus Acidiferrales bacterium]
MRPTTPESWRASTASLAVVCILVALLCTACVGAARSAGDADAPAAAPNNNSVPSLTALSPASAIAGAGSETLTLIGTDFVSGSTVTYNGVGHAATLVSSTQLTIIVSAADQAIAGSYAVVVTNPPPGGGASAPLDFTVAANNPQPTLT